MDCKHCLKIVETEKDYCVWLDGKLFPYIESIKIEREVKPCKDGELNQITIKYDEFPNGIGKKPVLKKELVLEGAKLEFS
ncbi:MULTISPECIES: hypothetical protein [Clostridia]|uniref:hypothetical protein n=1 Tax=Clostridia TaxID=186801 RepID=UPI002A88844A|nr:hypothetical protein [Peptostreptococcus porci]MDY5098781.1 hypothetical protein [Clostridium sp.]MDY5437446.1 hypothetical protein [Peptostreptococcus porci]